MFARARAVLDRSLGFAIRLIIPVLPRPLILRTVRNPAGGGWPEAGLYRGASGNLSATTGWDGRAGRDAGGTGLREYGETCGKRP